MVHHVIHGNPIKVYKDYERTKISVATIKYNKITRMCLIVLRLKIRSICTVPEKLDSVILLPKFYLQLLV